MKKLILTLSLVGAVSSLFGASGITGIGGSISAPPLSYSAITNAMGCLSNSCSLSNAGDINNLTGSLKLADTPGSGGNGVFWGSANEIFFDSSHPGGGEMIISTLGSISLNPGNNSLGNSVIQLGTSSATHEIVMVQYDTPAPDVGSPTGTSKYFAMCNRYFDGGSSSVKDHHLGFRSEALDNNGNAQLTIYSYIKGANQNVDDPANISVGSMGTNTFTYKEIRATNNLSAGGTISGNGAGITNLNYAVFTDQKANGTQGDTFTGVTWAKVTLNTTGLDSATAFSLSSSVFTVNAAGAGKWRIRAFVPIYDDNTNPAETKLRFRRTNNTAATLLVGPTCKNIGTFGNAPYMAGVITLTAGDTLELQAWCNSATPQFGRNAAGGATGEVEVYATIEFERQ